MGISLSDLSPKAREQVLSKFYAEQAKRSHKISKKPQRNKYHAKKVLGCLEDGTEHVFDSVKEFDRYAELAMMQREGRISELRVHGPFDLIPKQVRSNGKVERACSYIADFVYVRDGETIVEDIKGYRSPSSAGYAKFVIKRKLMLWVHGIEVHEI